MRVEFLYFEDCPSHEVALARLKKALTSVGVDSKIEIIRVQNDSQAQALSFPGSPTIRIDGQDIDPAGAGGPPSLTCRLYYKDDGSPTPLPSESLIGGAVRRVLHGE